jgi:two-component system response regulator QseB
MPGKMKRAFLVVEKGSPYCRRESFMINKERYSIGRAWEGHQPDLAFTSAYISRSHAEITFENDCYLLRDISKHGTAVNGVFLSRSEPYLLKHGDTIGLAGNEAILNFFMGTYPAETLPWPNEMEKDVILDEAKREVFINGELIDLTGNLYVLFVLLYKNRGHVVHHRIIKETVWPERILEKGNPLVRDEEVTVLIRRLRDKLGKHAELVCNKWGYGYFLK